MTRIKDQRLIKQNATRSKNMRLRCSNRTVNLTVHLVEHSNRRVSIQTARLLSNHSKMVQLKSTHQVESSATL